MLTNERKKRKTVHSNLSYQLLYKVHHMNFWRNPSRTLEKYRTHHLVTFKNIRHFATTNVPPRFTRTHGEAMLLSRSKHCPTCAGGCSMLYMKGKKYCWQIIYWHNNNVVWAAAPYSMETSWTNLFNNLSAINVSDSSTVSLSSMKTLFESNMKCLMYLRQIVIETWDTVIQKPEFAFRCLPKGPFRNYSVARTSSVAVLTWQTYVTLCLHVTTSSIWKPQMFF